MKTLVVSRGGDPLFVRDERGRDFEVETHWVSDARFRTWPQPEPKLDRLWEKVFAENSQHHRVARGIALLSSDDTLLVKAAIRILVAHLLPSLDDRDEQERRARAVERLGGYPTREVADRRDETHDEEWARQHPKARPSHPALLLPPGFDAMPRIPSVSMFFGMVKTTMPVFAEVSAAPSLPADRAAEPELSQADLVQARRQETMRRLQDPPATDLETDIKHLLDGLRSRPVL